MPSQLAFPAVLGYVEPVTKKYRKETLQDPCISRIGGPPAFLKTAPDFDESLITCPKCSKQMRLLLQLFAPEGQDRPHAYVRLIYVFTCDNGKCATDGWSPSFKVLRSQSTETSLRPETTWSPAEFDLMEIISEAEPAEVPSAPSSRDKGDRKKEGEFKEVMVENDGSEKYVKVKGDSAFYKFNKRLGVAPEQVLRYLRTEKLLESSDAATLWISDKGKLADKDVPACEHCKAARSIEFQIMPTLLSYLDIDDTKADTLDWGVLSVYTCNDACRAANDAFVEEKLFRQEYDMKTSIF
ncbi:protein of unknown function [Taphrina deformans PYCC 5710]|uniref:Programmed cell death protein 2 C-terminal domain-containing protein n=1 Tax=Taphrina deformans (strain PYCC 5710 / ATCC 11124 / CBS 356.35 / IMI 108563 / JCM 9778 / NBRC 8474) TaxID=1097556 RepID=R4XDF9_TAPDE|nr:protein of unknown function [Taphrina deformans PYCC 5710]|eukprot:CCG83870.1 protein of unknown function [Taphrina deformans PYCC 5710]